MTTAYLITFRTYGSRLHGDPDGSVDRDNNIPGTPFLPANANRSRFESGLLKRAPIELNAERRFVVEQTIRSVCAYRAWSLDAVNVRTTHVHIVVRADVSPERVMNDCKVWATRRMIEAKLLPPQTRAWARHGSTRYLNTHNSFARAIAYVRDEQGMALPASRPPGWRDEWSHTSGVHVGVPTSVHPETAP